MMFLFFLSKLLIINNLAPCKGKMGGVCTTPSCSTLHGGHYKDRIKTL